MLDFRPPVLGFIRVCDLVIVGFVGAIGAGSNLTTWTSFSNPEDELLRLLLRDAICNFNLRV